MDTEKALGDSEGPRFSQVRSRRQRIMLVDDEPTIVDAGKRILNYLGYSVLGVTESREALAILQQDPMSIDLLITDQSMPDMNGCDLTREVRKLLPSLPVILTTGSGSPQPELTELGIAEVLFKPFLASDLSAAIQRLLSDAPVVAAQNQGR